jgi:hypothetical protein
MKNSDMPANPISVSQGASGDFLTTDDYGVGMGLSKREHFAAMAMQGIASNHSLVDDAGSAEWVAKQSLSYADALLAALEES